MRGYHKRRSPAKIAIWSGAFLILSFTLAWKFQWLPGSGKTESPVEPNSEVVGDPKSAAPQPAGKNNGSPFDPTVFNAQTEPGGRDVSMPSKFGSPVAPAKFVGAASPLRKKQHLIDNVGAVTPPPRSETRFSRYGAGGGNRVAANRSSTHDPSRPSGDVQHASYEKTLPADDSAPPPEALQKIDALIRGGDLLAAHKELSQIYWKKPQWRGAIRQRIEQTAKAIYFDSERNFLPPCEVQPGDLLQTIARKYKVTPEYLARLNGIPKDRIRAGIKLKVIKGPFAAVVDLKNRELTIHHYGYFVAKYPVGVGKDGKSPVGKHKVDGKLVNPVYYGTDERTGRQFKISADDPNNPLGERWISIGRSFGIHGTIDPSSIGKAASRGCVRMHNADVEWVYDFLIVGSEVIIRK